MKSANKVFTPKDIPKQHTIPLQPMPKDQALFIIPPSHYQHIPNPTNLFKVSRTLSIAHRVRFVRFPCTYVTIVLLMSTQVYFLKPFKPRDVRNMLCVGDCCDVIYHERY